MNTGHPLLRIPFRMEPSMKASELGEFLRMLPAQGPPALSLQLVEHLVHLGPGRLDTALERRIQRGEVCPRGIGFPIQCRAPRIGGRPFHCGQPMGLPCVEVRSEFASGHPQTRRQGGPRPRNDPCPIPGNEHGTDQTERRVGRGQLKPIRHLGQSPDNGHIGKQVGLIQWTE